MVLDTAYIREVNTRIKLLKAEDWSGKYRYDVEGEFVEPSPRDVVLVLDEISDRGGSLSYETRDDFLRKMIAGRKVTVSHEEKVLGTFTLNDRPVDGQPTPRTPWESFDVFRDHPGALRPLMQCAITRILEKSLPPQTATPPAAAGGLPTQKSRGSSGGQG